VARSSPDEAQRNPGSVVRTVRIRPLRLLPEGSSSRRGIERERPFTLCLVSHKVIGKPVVLSPLIGRIRSGRMKHSREGGNDETANEVKVRA
jgi:hypothetical protein